MALWSAVALHLSAPPWRFGPGLIGSFGLVGLVRILAAPGIGRLVDRLGPDRIVAAGVTCTALGVLLLGLGLHPWWDYLWGWWPWTWGYRAASWLTKPGSIPRPSRPQPNERAIVFYRLPRGSPLVYSDLSVLKSMAVARNLRFCPCIGLDRALAGVQ